MSLRLSDLEAPSRRAGFHDELRRQIESADRANARRRRTAAAVAVGAAVVIASAASVSAFRGQAIAKTKDGTLSCPVPDQGGVRRLNVHTAVRAPSTVVNGHTIPFAAQAFITSGPLGAEIQYLGVTSLRNGVLYDTQFCTRAASIPLTHAGLPTVVKVSGTQGQRIDKECWLATTVRARMHISFGGNGAPVAAQLALRSGPKLRPAAFVDWTPTRITVYTAPSCEHG